MQDRILLHKPETVNPFDKLTESETAEYNTWSDSVNAETRDPLPEDFDSAWIDLEARDAYHAWLDAPMPIDDEHVESEQQSIEANWIEIQPDFDSMSTIDYLKWQESQQPGTLESYWQAVVKDAENLLKYARPDDDPARIENAKAILQHNERRVAQ